MKKYFIVPGICLAIGVCLNVNLQWNADEQGKLGVTMSNIEALANSENDSRECYYSGSLDCPKSGVKVKYIL